MRRASQNTGVATEDGVSLLSFGYDYCSEHEWGISGIQSALGVSNDPADLTAQRFAVTSAGDGNVMLIEASVTGVDYDVRPAKKTKHKRLYLLGGRIEFWKETPEQYVTSQRESYPKPSAPEALWDERTFMFSVPIGSEAEAVVRDVHAALLANDALVYLAGSRNPFGGSGLVIARRSSVPQKHIDTMEAGFRDAKKLKDAAEATGIRERVDAWGKTLGGWSTRPYHALSPRWRPEGDERSSAHPVVFWLNPTAKDRNNAGWFTVEDLEQWMEGKGPIPKAGKASA